LEQFDIASAEIPHIKDGRKAMLSSYGIDDAADITQAAVDAVPGFGGFLASQLIAWRSSLEVGFRFNPGRGVDPADLQRVDKEIANRRTEIEPLLTKGPANLNRLAKQILASRLLLQDQLQKAQMDLAQAQIDETSSA
jgi:DNA-binding helix-hairpin-helix protein with protein kinase domain